MKQIIYNCDICRRSVHIAEEGVPLGWKERKSKDQIFSRHCCEVEKCASAYNLMFPIPKWVESNYGNA